MSAILPNSSSQTAPRCEIEHFGASSRRPRCRSTWPPSASLGEAVDAIQQAEKEIGLPASMITTFQGAALAFQAALGNELILILAAIITMYIVLGVLYESYIHPITILSTLPSAGVGALLALMIDGSDLSDDRDHRHHPLDRHRQEERDHDGRLRPRRRASRGQVAARGDFSGLPAALPADPDDDDGGTICRTAADARDRDRLGAAPPVGGDYRRRSDFQPDADLVHDAGHLSRLRSARRLDAGELVRRGTRRARFNACFHQVAHHRRVTPEQSPDQAPGRVQNLPSSWSCLRGVAMRVSTPFFRRSKTWMAGPSPARRKGRRRPFCRRIDFP